MIVTTGGLGFRSPVSSAAASSTSSPSSETNSTAKPNSSATALMESLSRRRLMFAMMPSCMQTAMTSCGFTSSWPASSATEMNSLTRMMRGASSTPTAAPSSRSRWCRRRLVPSISAMVRRTEARISFSSTARFFPFFKTFAFFAVARAPAGAVRR